ncbi:Protein PHYTOCHROME KINASE SUBSTRATE like [Actinidia chinensis var. chinensis]|uniref:Protein PHYTOCHROME KINASE SUBSTRATE like n=1 Tax=Actinidia chinensis var. chinensis TaxID=1590841 RepID=A0A2R6P451_ACTCC|nr:Protein PHYTOCHROME KINASE SUBSTRATE like [Actinidia chinensis var. chinensis]
MAVVTISQTLSFTGNDHLCDASFLPYLNCSERNFVRKLAESSLNPNSATAMTPHKDLYLFRKKAEDGEIGVFGAEKYFNGVVDEDDPRASNNGGLKIQYMKNEPIHPSPMKPKIQPRTASVHSEASWNSQNALLRSVLRNQVPRKTKQRNGRSFLASLGCSCSCNGKNSVDIDENDGKSNSSVAMEPVLNVPDTVDLARANKSRLNPWVMEEVQCKKIDEEGIGLKREDCFTFPILNSKPGIPEIKVHSYEHEDDKQRNSLEVFGSPVLGKKTKSSSLDTRPAVWGWETSSESGEFEIPQKSHGMYNDNESEASADLFEIESFTNSGNQFLLRQGLNGMSSTCVTPTTCYAPSEVSIEWSVVTASVAEFSAISNLEDMISTAGTEKFRKMARNYKYSLAAGKELDKKRSGILLSCNSLKAVKVAGDAYRTNGKAVDDPQRRQRPSRDSAHKN